MEELKKKDAYRTSFTDVGELESYVGKELGLTNWYSMKQERINTFANATEDHQWIHVDEERSIKESPYKKTIAHGFLMLSMSSKIMFDSYEIKNFSMAINYGLDKVRFPNATPSGSRFRGRVSLMEFQAIPNGAKYKLSVVIELEGQEKPACVAECLALAYN
jgi:acyl dehydratase